MNLREDPVFAEAALNPKILAVAEFSVGMGFLFSQMTTSVKCEGAKGIALHADNNWLPAPFPDHNYITTFCWACDDFTKENGATLVIPGTKDLRRHPNEKEMENLENLEQLRAIEANWKVKVVNVDGQHIHGIDTYEQYKTLQQMMTNKILMTSNDEI